jgi:DNA-binding NtrC family response regulator
MTHHVHLPPLRERASDIPILLDYFLEKTASELNKKKPSYSPELPRLLSNHLFPGNVRELESMTRNALALHPGRVLSMESFRKHLKQASTACNMKPSRQPSEESVSFGERIPTLDQCRELLIAEAMRRAGDNQTIAAEMLGISRSALNKRINRGKSEVV